MISTDSVVSRDLRVPLTRLPCNEPAEDAEWIRWVFKKRWRESACRQHQQPSSLEAIELRAGDGHVNPLGRLLGQYKQDQLKVNFREEGGGWLLASAFSVATCPCTTTHVVYYMPTLENISQATYLHGHRHTANQSVCDIARRQCSMGTGSLLPIKPCTRRCLHEEGNSLGTTSKSVNTGTF